MTERKPIDPILQLDNHTRTPDPNCFHCWISSEALRRINAGDLTGDEALHLILEAAAEIVSSEQRLIARREKVAGAVSHFVHLVEAQAVDKWPAGR